MPRDGSNCQGLFILQETEEKFQEQCVQIL